MLTATEQAENEADVSETDSKVIVLHTLSLFLITHTHLVFFIS